MVERRLGRGLDFLLSGGAAGDQDEVAQIELAKLRPNPFQPRREFRAEELEELSASIREHGVLQPIVVRAVADGYEVVAGERRWRACARLGLATIPALVKTADDTQMLEWALVENIQRQDLNPIEEARAYLAYMQRLDYTQEQTAQRMGKSRSAIANLVRLLELPADLQELVSRGTLSMGHARALLGVADAETQRNLARRVTDENLSVRDVERAVRAWATPSDHPEAGEALPSAHLEELARRLGEHLGTRVTISDRAGSGRITIRYYSPTDLDRIQGLVLGATSAPLS